MFLIRNNKKRLKYNSIDKYFCTILNDPPWHKHHPDNTEIFPLNWRR